MPHVAVVADELLGRAPDVRQVHRRCPLILDRSFFLASSVEGLTPKIAEDSIYAFLEDERGLTVATSKRTITVERAGEKDRELLDLDGIDYLAVVASQTFDAQGVLIEWTQSRHRPDHFCFRDTAVRQRV